MSVGRLMIKWDADRSVTYRDFDKLEICNGMVRVTDDASQSVDYYVLNDLLKDGGLRVHSELDKVTAG